MKWYTQLIFLGLGLLNSVAWANQTITCPASQQGAGGAEIVFTATDATNSNYNISMTKNGSQLTEADAPAYVLRTNIADHKLILGVVSQVEIFLDKLGSNGYYQGYAIAYFPNARGESFAHSVYCKIQN